jgi:flagellar motility protein MotE (MotC chaperone)
MLKRNGENCEHPVPNYPGLLTSSEYKAYQAAIPVVAEQVRLYNERTKALTEIETQTPQIAEQIANQKNVPLVDAWQLRHTLFKSGRGEMQLCSRHIGGKEVFGVIERFDPNSAYAQAQGESQEIMRGNNAYLVLQNFVEGERHVLELFRKDIKATVEEKLSELFPKLDASRVVKAIGAQCGENVKKQGEKETQTRSVKIRM